MKLKRMCLQQSETALAAYGYLIKSTDTDHSLGANATAAGTAAPPATGKLI